VNFGGDAGERSYQTGLIADQLALLPERLQFATRFGWQPTIWGALLLAVAATIAPRHPLAATALEGELTAAAGVAGLLLIGYEIWRRRNRTVLVKDGGQIAVYRKRSFDFRVEIEDITPGAKPPLFIMMKIGVPLALAGVFLSALGIDMLLRERRLSADALLVLCFGLACLASLVSAAWVHFRYTHLSVPVRVSRLKANETVRLKPAEAAELLAYD
jgi:predicted membrane protein